jgi:replicative DNA helicase
MNAVRNDEAESAILGCILLDDTQLALNKAREILTADDFDPHKGALFCEICRSVDEKKPYDLLSLSKIFENDKIINRGFILEQMNAVVSSANIDHYISIVKDCSLRRKALMIIDQQKRKLIEGEDPNEIISSSTVALMQLVGKDSRSKVQSIRQVMNATYEEIGNRIELDYLGVQTDIESFNRYVGGVLRDCIVTIAGRPGTGKTTFTQQLLLYISQFYPGMFASLEMNSKRLGVKMLANATGINSRFIDLPKKLKGDEWPKVACAAEKLSERYFYIDDSVEMAASQIACRARRLKYENPEMLFLAVDYLQIIQPESGMRFENRKSEINTALRIFKSLARELNICVIILSQILREIEKTASGKPSLAHLKESGAIEEMSDIVLFLYKDQESEEKTKQLNRTDHYVTPVLIAKNKYGPPDVTFDLIFNRATSKFLEFAR